jgi:hypothetical protein
LGIRGRDDDGDDDGDAIDAGAISRRGDGRSTRAHLRSRGGNFAFSCRRRA